MPRNWKKESTRSITMLLGAFIYVLGVNQFVVPAGLYSGGFLGFAQLIRTAILQWTPFRFGGIDIAAAINFLLNIPGFLLAWKRMGKLYILKTLVCVAAMTVLMSFLPAMDPPILQNDVLASAIVGGLVGGLGIGLILRSGGSGGGVDVVSVLLLRKYRGLSVGRFGLLVNLLLYVIMAFLFDLHVVIYSIICAAVMSFTIDRIYAQNIAVEVHVITQHDCAELEQKIFRELDRGLTRWAATGAYAESSQQVLYVVLSKYEVPVLKRIVREFDPTAFIVINPGVNIGGNFMQHLS